jgi:DNA-binding transcriptional MocR family regulator
MMGLKRNQRSRIFLTSGASYGLHMSLTLFTSPVTGYTKRAFIVSPTYFLASRVMEDCGFADKMTAIRSTRSSIDFEALLAGLRRSETETRDVPLEEALRSVLRADAPKEEKRLFKYVMYCVPSYGNPTGETFDLETRKRLVGIAREWDMLVIADDVYDFLGNQDQPKELLPRLVTVDAETVEAGGVGILLATARFRNSWGPGFGRGGLKARVSYWWGFWGMVGQITVYASLLFPCRVYMCVHADRKIGNRVDVLRILRLV